VIIKVMVFLSMFFYIIIEFLNISNLLIPKII